MIKTGVNIPAASRSRHISRSTFHEHKHAENFTGSTVSQQLKRLSKGQTRKTQRSPTRVQRKINTSLAWTWVQNHQSMWVVLKKDAFVKPPTKSKLLQLVHVLRGDGACLFRCHAWKNKRPQMSTKNARGQTRSCQTSAEPSQLCPSWGPQHQLQQNSKNLLPRNICVLLDHTGKAGTNTATYWKHRRRSASSSPPRSRGSAAWTCSPGWPSYQRTWGQVEPPSSFDPTVTSQRWCTASVSLTLSCICWSQSDLPSHRRCHQEKPAGQTTSRFFFTIRESGRFKGRIIRWLLSWSQTNHAMEIMMKMKRTGGKKPNLNLFLLDGCLLAYQAQISRSAEAPPPQTCERASTTQWFSLNKLLLRFDSRAKIPLKILNILQVWWYWCKTKTKSRDG